MKKDVFIINNNKIIIGEYREIFGHYIFSYGAIFSLSNVLEEQLKYYKIISKEHCMKCPIHNRIKLLMRISEWRKDDEEREEYTKIIWNENTIKENKFNIYFTLGKNSVSPRYIFGEKRDNRLEGIVIEELTGLRGIEIVDMDTKFYDIIEPVIFQEDAWKIDRLNSKYYWTRIVPYEIRKTIDEIIEPLE